MGVVEKSLQGAIKQGEESIAKYIEKLVAQNEEIIDRLNWAMTSQQMICDHLKIKLPDPLVLKKEE